VPVTHETDFVFQAYAEFIGFDLDILEPKK
jgi:hypothetical protein